MYHQIDEVGLSIAHGNEKARLEAEIKELRAKVEELEKRNVVMREALIICDNYLKRVVQANDQHIPYHVVEDAYGDIQGDIDQALSTAPVKGWVRVGELEKTVKILEGVLDNFVVRSALRQPTNDELTRLQQLIKDAND
jgi:hypothetical protein